METLILIICIIFAFKSCSMEIMKPAPLWEEKHTDTIEDFQMLISGGYKPKRLMLTKYMVSLRTAKSTKYFGDNHICGGVIIAPSLVLTAAHCVVGFNKMVMRPNELYVVAGTPNRLRRQRTTFELEIAAIIPHSSFRRRSHNDIAILRLASVIPSNNANIRIIQLPRMYVRVGSNCTALGWGELFTNGPYADEAVYVNFPIVSHRVCVMEYEQLYGRGMLCGYDKFQPERNVCRGDSGGPLICDGTLMGIVSWGMHCLPNYPVVFSDLVYHQQWINSVDSALYA